MPDFELQRIALPTGVELDVVAEAIQAIRRSSCSTAFPNRTAPGGTRSPNWRRIISSSRPTSAAMRRSSKPEGVANYTPDKIVGDLLALADHFGIDRFTLVGHDWGGAIAWMAALQQPDRVARLIIINAPHPVHLPEDACSTIPRSARRASISAPSAIPISNRHIAAIGPVGFFRRQLPAAHRFREGRATKSRSISNNGASPAR